MTNPAPLNHHCVYDVLNHAMDAIPTDAARWSLRSDAEVSRNALLDGLEFIGSAIQASTVTGRQPHHFTPSDVARLSSFLMCAPDLIRAMNAVIESYKEPATCEGTGHV